MRAGDFHVGVRTDDAALLETLRDTYTSHLREDRRARDDFGLVIGASESRGIREVPHLAHGKQQLLRSRSTMRLVRRLDLELATLVGHKPAGTVALRGLAAIVGSKRAALVPSSVAQRSSAVERAITRAGAAVAEDAGLRLDPLTGELLVPAGLTGCAAADGDPLAVVPGRYPVGGMFWFGRDHAVDERPATGLVRLLSHVHEPVGLSHGQTLRGLATMRGTFSAHPLAVTGITDLEPVLDCVA